MLKLQCDLDLQSPSEPSRLKSAEAVGLGKIIEALVLGGTVNPDAKRAMYREDSESLSAAKKGNAASVVREVIVITCVVPGRKGAGLGA